MTVHSKHTDPALRRKANALLRAAGYTVSDPLEETPFGPGTFASAHYKQVAQNWRQLAIFLTVVTLASVLSLAYVLTRADSLRAYIVEMPARPPAAVVDATK